MEKIPFRAIIEVRTRDELERLNRILDQFPEFKAQTHDEIERLDRMLPRRGRRAES